MKLSLVPSLCGLLALACVASAEFNLRSGLAQARLAVQDAEVDASSKWSFLAKEVTAKRVSGLTMALVLVFCCCCVMPIVGWLVFMKAVATLAAKGIEEFQNACAKKLREEFDAECPEDEKNHYCSQEFKDECDQLFDESDKDGNGTLDIKELKAPVKKYLGDPGKDLKDSGFLEMLTKAFDDDKSQHIDKTEFFEMMKLVKFRKDQAAKKKAADEENAKKPLSSRRASAPKIGENDNHRDP